VRGTKYKLLDEKKSSQIDTLLFENVLPLAKTMATYLNIKLFCCCVFVGA
jgi:hypothetical protein